MKFCCGVGLERHTQWPEQLAEMRVMHRLDAYGEVPSGALCG